MALAPQSDDEAWRRANEFSSSSSFESLPRRLRVDGAGQPVTVVVAVAVLESLTLQPLMVSHADDVTVAVVRVVVPVTVALNSVVVEQTLAVLVSHSVELCSYVI